MNNPQIITFDVTYKCNLACNMCQTKFYYQERHFKSPLTKQEVIDTAKRLHDEDGASFFRFVGAEPLLHPDIIEIVQEVSHFGTTWLTTNGTLIAENTAEELVKSGLSILVISLHSRSEHYKRIPADQVIDKTLNGIQFIDDARKNYNSNLSVIVTHVVTPENYNHIFKLYNLTSKYDVDITFCPVHSMRQYLEQEVSSWRGQRAIYLGDSNNEPSELNWWQYWIFRFQQSALQFKHMMILIQPLLITTGLLKRSVVDFYSRIIYRPCVKPSQRMAIRGDGKITICEFMRTIEIGSIRDEDLWNTEARKEIIDIVDKGSLNICRECNRRSMYRPSLLARFE